MQNMVKQIYLYQDTLGLVKIDKTDKDHHESWESVNSDLYYDVSIGLHYMCNH